jgi:hypothetical protein
LRMKRLKRGEGMERLVERGQEAAGKEGGEI